MLVDPGARLAALTNQIAVLKSDLKEHNAAARDAIKSMVKEQERLAKAIATDSAVEG